MDIFILSNLEILKTLLNKMCNLHIGIATYYCKNVDEVGDDKRPYKFTLFHKIIIRYTR